MKPHVYWQKEAVMTVVSSNKKNDLLVWESQGRRKERSLFIFCLEKSVVVVEVEMLINKKCTARCFF